MGKNYQIDETFLPYHGFLNYCKNCLINILKYADNHNLSKEEFNFNTDSDYIYFKKLCDNDDIDRDKWLIENGNKDAMYKFYYKHLFFSLISDFLDYYTVSIENAFKENMNVAWSLLRKPLQETLAYIEWLYIDKDELINLMINGKDATEYEIIKKKNKIKKHIQLIDKTDKWDLIDMFDFRYSYNEKFTLNGILQATNHLITTRPALKTSQSGLNYIFWDEEIKRNSVGFYYTSIPYVMRYMLQITMEMFEDIAKLKDYTKLMNGLNLMLKYLYALHSPFKDIKELLSLEQVTVVCPKCGEKHNSDKMWMNFICDYFECSKCHEKINTYQYIFDFEEITFIK